MYEAKKTKRTEEEPTRPSHLKRTSSVSKPKNATDDEERHYYMFVPSAQEYKKTRWTERGIENLRKDLAVAQETIIEFKDLINELETKAEDQHKKATTEEGSRTSTNNTNDRSEKKSSTRGVLGSSGKSKHTKVTKKEREKQEKIEKLKKEQAEMLKDLDDILEAGSD